MSLGRRTTPSQAVESMHKTLNQYVRGILQGETEKWEEALMYATLILRSAPMACLGGRCPYEVVTGLKPRLPGTLSSGLPVTKQTTDGYVEDLLNHLKDCLLYTSPSPRDRG